MRELEELNSLLFEPKFERYAATEAQFAKFTCCQSNVGGTGWELPSGIGVYCLNTATCSFAGLEDPETRQKISDKERLMIDTRSLYQWLQQTPSENAGTPVMHHPFDWLVLWAKEELENIVSENFRLVLTGHIHKGASVFSTCGAHGAVYCVAPALFTRKRDELGYSFVSLDTASGQVDIVYRQKTPKHNFVAGVDLSENDTGTKSFPVTTVRTIQVEVVKRISEDTIGVLGGIRRGMHQLLYETLLMGRPRSGCITRNRTDQRSPPLLILLVLRRHHGTRSSARPSNMD